MQIWHVTPFALLVLGKPQAPAPPPKNSSSPSAPPGAPPVPPPSTPPATPTPSGSPTPAPKGPICECGYTYCASVLKAMKAPWSNKELAEAYCKTPNASCPNGKPSTNVDNALYVCLCEKADQKTGTHLDLLCGCDKCLVVGPDFRGRCETPCSPGSHK
ncbi:hypothetical protein ISF_07096 [Cordyceps fumosorosea ARSEF 2679]|uniref:Uncharacterized protein n=1 Tax=Cordyceps fumosorosea (strain ARSEF 2679) TaxID=1081104 RepID=A0A167Q078_CORFA|nr:hypothetical protein ISF_07096 [Cordyceps fumosorosea ARSEF 2679]OAA57175.1 hypothetical protein ISF_07096 [Cordyceps fumosorosea ARSEF 2679]